MAVGYNFFQDAGQVTEQQIALRLTTKVAEVMEGGQALVLGVSFIPRSLLIRVVIDRQAICSVML